jgi:hypothetical protein
MENPKKFDCYECDLGSFCFKCGYLHAVARKTVPTSEKYRIAFEMIRHMTVNEPVCMLLDMGSTSLILMDETAKELMARSLPGMFKAIAVLAPSTLQKVAPTIFLNTMGQPVPIRIFDDEWEADAWLRKYF